MTFGGFHRGGPDAPMAEINMIPLIDVMLVLLVKADRTVYCNGEFVNPPTLPQRMAAAGRSNPQPEVHIRADAAAQYQIIAEVMAAAERS